MRVRKRREDDVESDQMDDSVPLLLNLLLSQPHTYSTPLYSLHSQDMGINSLPALRQGLYNGSLR